MGIRRRMCNIETIDPTSEKLFEFSVTINLYYWVQQCFAVVGINFNVFFVIRFTLQQSLILVKQIEFTVTAAIRLVWIVTFIVSVRIWWCWWRIFFTWRSCTRFSFIWLWRLIVFSVVVFLKMLDTICVPSSSLVTVLPVTIATLIITFRIWIVDGCKILKKWSKTIAFLFF